MKIVHLYDGHEQIGNGQRGSVPNVVWNLSKHTQDRGHDVTIIERAWDGCERHETKCGVNFDRIQQYIGSNEPWKDIPYQLVETIPGKVQLFASRMEFAAGAYQKLLKYNPDVIHIHLPFSGLILAMVSPSIRKRAVYTAHIGEEKKRLDITPSPDLLLAKRVNHVTTLNEDIKQGFVSRGVKDQNISTLSLGTEFEKFSSGNTESARKEFNLKNKPTVLFAGSVTPRKRPFEMVKELTPLINSGDIQVIIAGKTDLDEDYVDSLKQFIKVNGLAEQVKIVGFVDESSLVNLMTFSDIFILPSIEEGFGMVITEAMASGTPVIGTNTGGIPRQIKDGENGYLINPDGLSQIPTLVKNIIQDEDHMAQMSKLAKEFSKGHSWKNIVEEYIELYDSIDSE